jgi:hypothetical protein
VVVVVPTLGIDLVVVGVPTFGIGLVVVMMMWEVQGGGYWVVEVGVGVGVAGSCPEV